MHERSPGPILTQHMLGTMLDGATCIVESQDVVDSTRLQTVPATLKVYRNVICVCSQSILPRGQYHNPLREKNTEINDLLNEKIPTMPNAQFLYFDPHLFVNAHDGSINHHDMYDFLHLTEAGYQKYVEPLVEEIQTLLKNFMTADALSVGDTES